MSDRSASTQSTPVVGEAVRQTKNDKKRGARQDAVPPSPTLAAYYAKPTPRLGDWIKAIKDAKLTGFATEDVEAARSGLTDSDPDLRKTHSLAVLSNAPAPVRRWVTEVTQHALKAGLQHFLFDPAASAAEQIGRIAEGLAPGLHSRDKRVRIRNETLLVLALQLIRTARPDFDAGDILATLFKPLRMPTNNDGTSRGG